MDDTTELHLREPGPAFQAAKAAGALSRIHNGLPVLVAAAIDDGDEAQPGVFIQVGFAGLSVADAEMVAATIMRDIISEMERDSDPEHCSGCRARHLRLMTALEVLRSGGLPVPTGPTRGLIQ